MDDTSFLYYTQDEVLKNIQIHERLKKPFKRVMKVMQEYFNANGYTKEKDYAAFLKKYLLDDSDRKLTLMIGHEEDFRPGVAGYYSYRSNKIVINEILEDRNDYELDQALCHEFIHFLTMHDRENIIEEEIKEGGFTDEALTEMLAIQMYPKCIETTGYKTQVEMHKFANLLSGKVNNYSEFLSQGGIDAAHHTPAWKSYIEETSEFQKDFNKGCMKLEDAIKNSHYIKAQRELIELFVLHGELNSLDDYCDYIKKLCDRVVPDDEYIENVYSKLDDKIIRSLDLKNPILVKFYKEKLKEIRELVFKQHEMEQLTLGKKIYEFELGGQEVIIDDELHFVTSNLGLTLGTFGNLIKVKLNKDEVVLDLDKIKFKYREDKEGKKIKEISNMFSLESKNDPIMISSAIKQDGDLVKLERFDLPTKDLNSSKANETVYVATYTDRIVLLKDNKEIKTIDKIDNDEYLGISPGLVWREKIGSIENGIVYSLLNEGNIKSKINDILEEELKNKTTQTEFEKYEEKYKDEREYFAIEDNYRNYVFRNMAIDKYDELPEDKKQELINKVIEDNDSFVISTKDGEVDVSLMFGVCSFRGYRSVLYDANGEGLYNGIMDELEKNKVIAQNYKKVKAVIKKDERGNIILPKEGLDKEIESLQNKLELQDKKIEEYQKKIAEIEKFLNNNKKNAM